MEPFEWLKVLQRSVSAVFLGTLSEIQDAASANGFSFTQDPYSMSFGRIAQEAEFLIS